MANHDLDAKDRDYLAVLDAFYQKNAPDVSLPLHEAAWRGLTGAVELFLSLDATIDGWNDQGMTPLHLAAKAGHKEVVKLLVERGANINALDNFGWSPLRFASKVEAGKEHREIIQLLKEHGAKS